MRCDEFEAALHDDLDRHCPPSDGSPGDDPALREHAAVCADCRTKLLTMMAIIEATERLDEPAASPDLPARVLGELHAAARVARRSHGWVMPVPAWAALAASLLLAITAWWLIGDREGREVARITIPEGSRVAIVTPPVAVDDTTASNVDPRWLLPPLWSWETAGNTTQAPSPAVSVTMENSFDAPLRSSLAPVADSTTSALDALWQALSASGEDVRS